MDAKLEGVTTEVWNGPWQEWFENLQKDIWTSTAPSCGFPKGMWIEKRRLTDQEWRTAQTLMGSKDELIFQLVNACMGFGCGVYIGVMIQSTFPGVPDEVKWLAFITKDHLPLSVCELREKGERGADLKDRTYFEDGWRAFSPYSHSDKNAANLKRHKMEAPQSKGHYDY